MNLVNKVAIKDTYLQSLGEISVVRASGVECFAQHEPSPNQLRETSVQTGLSAFCNYRIKSMIAWRGRG